MSIVIAHLPNEGRGGECNRPGAGTGYLSSDERRVMSKLIALVLAGALAAVLFFWRKSEGSWSSMWSSAKDSSSEWSETAAQEAGNAADRVAAAADRATAAASDLADELKESASQAAHEAGKAAERAAQTDDDVTTVATNLSDEVKGGKAVGKRS